jgi:UrcA family protein
MKYLNLINGVVVTVAAIAFSVPAVASADSGPQFKGTSEKVQYSDLDIRKREGAEQLYRRLQAASKRVCGVEPLKVTGSIEGFAQARRCYRQSLDAAVAKLDNDTVTKIHEG